MQNKQSLFVVFEGIDGSGKTTIINKLKESLEKDKEIQEIFEQVITTKEPGGENIEFCKKIRDLLINKNYSLNNKTKSLLFLANRSEHIEKFIIPLLNKKNLILCDRFFLSTLVYQGENKKVSDWIKTTQDLISPVIPDITFYINISNEEFIKRHRQRIQSKKNNLFDDDLSKDLNNYKKKYENFINENQNYMGKIVRLNGEEQIDLLISNIKKEILKIKDSKTFQ